MLKKLLNFAKKKFSAQAARGETASALVADDGREAKSVYPLHDCFQPLEKPDSKLIAKSRSEAKANLAAIDVRDYPRVSLSISELAAASAIPPLFRLTIKGRGYDNFFIKKEGSEKLYIVFSGSRAPGEKHPLFKRQAWNYFFDGDVLYAADPCLELYPDLALGWYLGDASFNPLADIAAYVDQLRKIGGYRRIISYGSSGGGFASLKFSDYIDCDCVAINPQIFLPKYPAFADAARKLNLNRIPNSEKRIDIRFKENSKFLILQNDCDDHHVSQHLLPLLAKRGIKYKYGLAGDSNLRVWNYHADGGHNSQENKYLLQFILYLADKLWNGTEDFAALDNLAIAVSEMWALDAQRARELSALKTEASK